MPTHSQRKRPRFHILAYASLNALLVLTSVRPALAAPSLQAPLNELLQFTAHGHVLGFGARSMVIGSLNHALTVEWLNAKRVDPAVDQPPAQAGRPEATKSQARPLGKVTYAGLWPGITVEYAASEKSVVKSTYRLQAGLTGNPVARIRLKYSRPVRLDAEGNLVVRYEQGEMKEAAPVAWQERGAARFPVPVKYVIQGEREVGFAASYDPQYPLVIDPDLVWNTFVGSSGGDVANAVAVDANGSVCVTGRSSDTWGSPIHPYDQYDDAFVAKFDANGNLLWNTFLGGADFDEGTAIAVDGSGNIYAAGLSPAIWGAPVRTFSGSYDGYVAKLDANGNLIWNTFLGGTGYDDLYSVTVDASGNIYAAGTSQGTWGAPVRAYAAGTDVCVSKLNNSGSLVWNTFLGGSDTDEGFAVASDTNGFVYAAGISDATWGVPVRAHAGNGLSDAFASKLNGSTGALVWNTFLGGTATDYGRAIAADGTGNVFVTGYSPTSWGAPVNAHHGGNDGFVAKLAGNGSLAWNTFWGGTGNEVGYAFAMDGRGDLYVAGYSNATWGSPIAPYSGGFDGTAAKINSSGTLLWNTFLGSSDYDFFYGLALDTAGDLHVVGQSATTWGSPVNPHNGNGEYDALVARISGDIVPVGSPTPTATVTATKSPTLTLTPTGTRTLTPTTTPTITRTISVTASATPSVTQSVTPSSTMSATLEISATPTPTVSMTQSRTITRTHTGTPTPAVSSRTATPTGTVNLTATATKTATASPTSSKTETPGPSRTSTGTPANTRTATLTPVETAVYTRTAEPENPFTDVDLGTGQVLAFPNPAKERVTLLTDLPSPALIKARIFNMSGELIATLSDHLPAGPARGLVWDCGQMPPGVYFVRLMVNDEEKGTAKVVVIK